jgi:anion-transporting  ArsA/GET3 family ATPase
MAAEARPALLARRLVIVTGKGGTGKTTVAAALALAGCRAGRRVLVAEVGLDEHLPRLIDPDTPPVGYAGRELLPGLRAMRIDPFEALGEYLGLQLHGRALVNVALRNRAFRQLMEASPGWRELITLGKVWHLAQARDESDRPLYDLIVVDAPATGHGVTFLDVPRVVVSAVRMGPLRRHAGLVADMVQDREHTVLLPVALAEELPVRETAELVARARDEVGIAIEGVVVNAVMAAPFPAELEDLPSQLAALPADCDLGPLPPAPALAACASYLASRHELNRAYLAELEELTGLPATPLPYLAGGIEGRRDLETLADALLGDGSAEDRREAAQWG